MLELEVKILNVDVKQMQNRLKQLRAKKLFEGPVRSVFFDTQKGELKRSGTLLRLRRKKDRSILTLKRRRADKTVKAAEEYESGIDRYDEVQAILERLGYVAYKSDSKHRISYRLKRSLVEIDIRKDVPPYIEIESPTRREVKEIVMLLGYTMDETRPWSTGELLKSYKKP
jgi:adenylate cyclase, class 2